MTPTTTASAAALETAAQAAGLTLTSAEPGTDFSGNPTVRYMLSLAADPSKNQPLELSEGFDASESKFAAGLASFLQETATRLRNPRPDVFLSLIGLPLSFGKFAWPFHGSTSGADTQIVHGEVRLEEGGESILHAKVSASMTLTFAEIVPALEQPFAEGFIYNAVRKTMDQGQLELGKSGNRQPVPVTTRVYSPWKKRFNFNDTTEGQRQEYLSAKVFWLTGVLGGGQPVWLIDPRDAQYLNATVEDLRKTVTALAGEGLIHLAADTEYATATEALMGHRAQYANELAQALAFIKPS